MSPQHRISSTVWDCRWLSLGKIYEFSGLGWRTAEIHQALLSSFRLAPANYTLTQLRYDLRKMKAHGLLQRDGRRYAYTLTEQGTRAALLFVLFHHRVCGPLADSLFHHRPAQTRRPHSKLDAAYRKADRSLDQIIQLLAA